MLEIAQLTNVWISDGINTTSLINIQTLDRLGSYNCVLIRIKVLNLISPIAVRTDSRHDFVLNMKLRSVVFEGLFGAGTLPRVRSECDTEE